MSLLSRVENAAVPTANDDRVNIALGQPWNEIVAQARKKLYEQLSASAIAEMIGHNQAMAQREVSGALDIVMRHSPFNSLSENERDECVRSVMDLVIGLGPIERFIDDPEITEIMINGPSHVFLERHGVLYPSTVTFSDAESVRIVVDKILGPVGRRVDEQSPMVSARLAQGHRINVVIAPIAVDGPYVTIRKFRDKVFDLNELMEMDALDECIAQFLKWAVISKKNIAVSGGTGSGKTTLLNALSLEIPKDERIVTIEDAAELKFQDHPNLARLEARPESIEGAGEVTIRDMVTNALRMRPDRIIVGECRGAEALDMLQAMNTGHDGSLTTLHANSTREVVNRLVMMVRFGSDLPVDIIERQIYSSLDLIVHLARQRDGKRRLVEIDGCEPTAMGGKLVPCVIWDDARNEYLWETPQWVFNLEHSGIASNEEVSRWFSRISLL